jgi:hypothetical protein
MYITCGFYTTNFSLVSRTENEMLQSNKQYLQNSQTTAVVICVISELEIQSVINVSKLGNTQTLTILGAFAKLRKVIISFVMYVRLFVRMENSAPTGRIFMILDI